MRDEKQLSIRNYRLPITNSLLILSSCVFLVLYADQAITAIPKSAPIQLMLLSPGVRAADVEVIQVQLKALGYYNDLIDGQYGSSIQNAVTRFQQEQGFKKADTIADESTRQHLQEVLSGKIKCNTSPPVTEEINTQIQAHPTHPKNDNWWKIISFGFLVSVGAFLYIAQRLADSNPDVESGNLEQPPLNPFTQKKQDFFSNLLLLFHHQCIQQNYYQLNILLWYLVSICLTDQWQIYTVVI